jgi:hypothetical protein
VGFQPGYYSHPGDLPGRHYHHRRRQSLSFHPHHPRRAIPNYPISLSTSGSDVGGHTRPDERRISKLESAIEADEKIIAKIQTAFYGGVPVKGFEAPFEGNAGGAVASLLAKVIAARDQLLKALRLDPKQALAKDGEVKKGNVGGIQIRSSNLGVILDNSSSMQPHIPELRKEIDGGFPGSHFREVYGCALTWRAGPTKPGSKRDLVILAMEDLIIVKQTDALYWFSDLRDPQTEAGLVHLGDLLQRSGALFYVASVDQKPENELEDLITEFKKK